MQSRETQSFKPLTISAEQLPASTARRDLLTAYAASRARLLLGCYRTGDANDAETYVAAITAILSRYSEEIITLVTHPATGLPSQKNWLPTVKEVADACNEAYAPIAREEHRLRIGRETMEERGRVDRGERPTMEEMKAKYGPNWGIDTLNTPPANAGKPVPSWDEIVKLYTVDHGRIGHLADMHKLLRDDESRAEAE